MIGLAKSIPFLVRDLIQENNENFERLQCHVRLLQIMNVCSAYQINIETTYLLERMIAFFTIKFNSLYPGWIVPKFHFVGHIPRYIRMFGPARQQWCFQFQRVHQYFKELVLVVCNCKNMPLTMSY